MLHRNAKTELLKQVPLFQGCSRRELDRIAAVADEVDVPEGRALTREGEPGREFVILVNGTAEVRRKGRRVNLLAGGDFFGEIALLRGTPRTATVTTTAPSQVLVLTATAFRRVLRDLPSLQLKVLEELARRLPDVP